MKNNIIAVCLGTTFAVFLAELLLWLVFPQATMNQVYKNNAPIFQKSELLPYVLKPNSSGNLRSEEFDTQISINRLGYRGREFESQKKPGRLRILAIGDSFTFGHGVNDQETYPNRLNELLAPSVEVINGGYASGYSPDTYYLYLKKIGLGLQPDIILVGLFIGNDIDHVSSDENEWAKVDQRGLPLQIVNVDSVVEGGYWISRTKQTRYSVPVLRNSHLFQLIWDRLVSGNPEEQYVSGKYSRHRTLDSTLFIFYADYPERTKLRFEQTRTLITQMHNLAKQNNSILIPVLIPELSQLNPETIPAYLARPPDLDFDKPQQLLVHFLNEQGVRVVDLLPAMKQIDSQTLYFPRDRHWTVYGHNLAAQIIAKFLRSEGLIEPMSSIGAPAKPHSAAQ